jgi:nitroreductase
MLQIVIGTICGRRSIREGFTEEEVGLEVIDDIVRCGLAAPSSKNAQPWKLHVVTDRQLNARVASAMDKAKGADRYVPINPLTGEARAGMTSTVVESAVILEQAALGIYVESHFSFSGGRLAMLQADADRRRSALIGFALDMVGIGAMVENMWLAAESHGVRGVFMGDVMIAEEFIGETLGFAGDLVGVLALGHSPHGGPAPKQLARDRVVRHG